MDAWNAPSTSRQHMLSWRLEAAKIILFVAHPFFFAPLPPPIPSAAHLHAKLVQQSRAEQVPSANRPSFPAVPQSRSPSVPQHHSIVGCCAMIMMPGSSSPSLSLLLLLPSLPTAWAANQPTESMVFPRPHQEVYRSLSLAISLIGLSRPVTSSTSHPPASTPHRPAVFRKKLSVYF